MPGVVHEDHRVLACLLVHADFQVQVSHFVRKCFEVGVHDYLNLVFKHPESLQALLCIDYICVDRIQVSEAFIATLCAPVTVVMVADQYELALVRDE